MQSVYAYTIFFSACMQSMYTYTLFYEACMQSVYPYTLFRESVYPLTRSKDKIIRSKQTSTIITAARPWANLVDFMDVARIIYNVYVLLCVWQYT